MCLASQPGTQQHEEEEEEKHSRLQLSLTQL